MRSVRRFLAALALVALVAAPAAAVTNERAADQVDAGFAPPMMDVLVLRPVGLIGLMMSAILWVPAEAMTLAVNPSQWKMPVDHLLARPARYVFVDPIGSH